MLLFIDRLPLYAWKPAGALSDVHLLSVCFPMLITEPHQIPHPRARPQRWALDTRFTGEAYAWRQHLIEAGLNPDALRYGSTYLVPLGGTPQEFPLRRADLWLVSNLPALRSTPHRIGLKHGIAFRDVQALPNPESNCPLFGMRALESAGLKVVIDGAANTVSVWVPGSWHQKAWLFLRRAASGFSTVSQPWGQL